MKFKLPSEAQVRQGIEAAQADTGGVVFTHPNSDRRFKFNKQTLQRWQKYLRQRQSRHFKNQIRRATAKRKAAQ